MKAMFVYPSLLPGHKPKYGVPPMGILHIAAELRRRGVEAHVLDAEIEGLTVEEMVSRILDVDPDLVGFSIMTPQLHAALEASVLLKQARPSLPLVLGGAHISSTHEDTFEFADCFDFAVYGEGELTMIEVVERLAEGKSLPGCLEGINGVIYRREDGTVVRNPPRAWVRDLDTLVPIDYDVLDIHKYRIPTLPGPPVVGMMISRGCPFKCTYCDAPTTTGVKIRFHSPERAAEDIRYYQRRYGVKAFSFRDSTFTANRKWVLAFCDALLKSPGPKTYWRCNTRVDVVDDEMLGLMRRAGCYTINFGVESGHPEILKNIRKEVALERIYKAHELTRKHGIRTYTTFLVGSIGETEDTIKTTMKVAAAIRPSLAMYFVTIAYPGTQLYNEAVAKKLVEPRWWANDYWDPRKNTAFEQRWGWSAGAGALKIPGFDSEKWQKRATRSFYLRPRFVWDTMTFTARNPYFFKYAVVLSKEVLPFYRLRLPWRKTTVAERSKVYSRCPSQPTADYTLRGVVGTGD
jgi:anaerobic magnesium-protoporphyrin IX monomethyl ester cyclase